MLVLIDESGCPGFKLTKGSTSYFIVAMVIFEDFSEAEKASKEISLLRQELRINPEFKFSKTRPEIKDKFFETICKYAFKVHALVVDKSKIYSQHLRKDTDSFYNFFVKSLIKYDNGILANASIKIDESGDKVFKKSLSSYLRRQLGQHKVKKIKFSNSKKDNLIQLADMVAGAIARSYNKGRKDSGHWLTILQKRGKVENIWNFG